MTSVKFMKSFANNAGVSQKNAREILAALEKTIVDCLNSGESFKVADVNMSLKEVPQHEGRNPSTGDVITIPAKNKVCVKVSTSLKNAVNE